MTVKLPEKSHIASFDVDCQNTFTPLCPNELPVPDGHTIVAELNRQASLAKYRLGSKDAHHTNAIWIADKKHPQLSKVEGDNVDVRWRPHAIHGTFGFELIAGLPKITDYNFFVWKGIELDMHPYGACYHDHAEAMSTGVIEFLRYKGVDTILVGGLTIEYCVKTTVLQLCKAKFRVIVNKAATRGFSPKAISNAIKTMQQAGAEIIGSCDDLPQGNE